MSTEQTFKIVNGVYEGPEHWKGSLDLRRCKETLTSLGDLEKVESFLDLEGCTSLTTLGELKIVGGRLDLRYCTNLITLGNLETVKKAVYLNERAKVPLKEVQEKIKYYTNMPAHEALNAITTKEVQAIPLYKNILTETLQKGCDGEGAPLGR